jgi:hypothetical protein
VADLIKPDILADRTDVAADFELTPEQTVQERLQLQAQVEASLALFAGNLQQIESLEDLVELLVFADPAGEHRFMPNQALTPIYAAGIAILARSRHLERALSNLQAFVDGWESRPPQFLARLPVWNQVAVRLLVAANTIRS